MSMYEDVVSIEWCFIGKPFVLAIRLQRLNGLRNDFLQLMSVLTVLIRSVISGKIILSIFSV